MALPPPLVPQINDGVITGDSINSMNGVLIGIPIYQSAQYNYIRLFINDKIINEFFIENAADLPKFYTQPPHLLPNGFYTVYYTATDAYQNSATSAKVTFNVVNHVLPVPQPLDMILTTGAANQDYTAIRVNPRNRGVIFGAPGAAIKVNVSLPAIIDESGSNSHQIILNQTGQGDFSVYSNDQGLVTVAAYDENNPSENVTRQTSFGAYQVGNDRLKAFNYSTGAPANGRTFNSIYLMALATSNIYGNPIDFVRISVSGDTIINGYSGQQADISLNSDQSATINLQSLTPKIVTAELTLPQASGTIQRINTVFVVPLPVRVLPFENIISS